MPTKTPLKSKKPKARPAQKRKAATAPARPRAVTRSAKPEAQKSRPARRPAPAVARPVASRPVYVPRALPVIDDDDDILMTHGAGGGAGYGRCGGRMLGSALEQTICDRLGQAGVAHSHSPRHFEVNLQEKQVAAYAPMIVLRGRGREGKSVVVECAED